MPPTTLLQFWQQERDVYEGLQSKAQADLDGAQKDQAQAVRDLAAEQKVFKELDGKIAADRAKLAVTTVPSEAKALVDALTANLIKQRSSQGKILDVQQTTDDARGRVDAAGPMLARATARLAAAEAKLASAKDENKLRQACKAAVAKPPLSTLKDDAAAALTGPEKAAASTKLKDIPAELQAIAKERWKLWAQKLTATGAAADAAEAALAGENDTNGGVAGKGAKESSAFRRAEGKLKEYAEGAKTKYDRALALFARVGQDAVLTDAQKKDASDATLLGDRQTAQKNALKVVADQAKVDTAAAVVDSTVLDSQLKDIDADVSQDADVVAKKAALDGAKGDLKSDSTANYPDKEVLDAWQAVVPDAAWQKLLDYEQAKALLTDLSGTTPATLASDRDTKEAKYVSALLAAAQSQRRVDYIEDAIACRQANADDIANALSARLPSAVRGDSF